jgi:hypothetical protein
LDFIFVIREHNNKWNQREENRWKLERERERKRKRKRERGEAEVEDTRHSLSERLQSHSMRIALQELSSDLLSASSMPTALTCVLFSTVLHCCVVRFGDGRVEKEGRRIGLIHAASRLTIERL